MGVRAYGRETLASLPIDVDKNWNGRSISNVNSLQANEHITITARGANRNLHPSLNRYDSETDGWYVSKDNNDIERKFWKDDFSVDSSENYSTISGSASPQSFDTDHLILPTNSGFQIPGGDVIPGKIRLVIGQTGVTSPMMNSDNQLQVRLSGSAKYTLSPSNGDLLFRCYNSGAATNTLEFAFHEGAKVISVLKTFNTTEDCLAFLNSTWVIEIETLSDGTLKVTIPGLSKSVTTTWAVKTADRIRPCIISYALKSPIKIYEITTSPSISYSDNFSTDTVSGANGRYVTVAGTIAYDTNRMSLASTAAYSAKARLKSYKLGSGIYSAKFTLPSSPTEEDGAYVVFDTDVNLLTGYGVGIKKSGSDWIAATVINTTVIATSTVITGVSDGDQVTIDIERDIEHGVTYYYIYGTTKPTEPNGMIYNTTQEMYVGWWYRNFGASPNTIYLDDISIRAESIVGRTNVPVEEAFWFRDEATVNALGRFTTTGTWAHSTDKYACSSAGHLKLDKVNVKEQTTSFSIAIPSGNTSYFYLEGHQVKMAQGATTCAITLQTVAGVTVGSTTWTKTVDAGTAFVVEVVSTDTTIVVKDGVGGTAQITETVTPTVTYDRWYLSSGSTLDTIQISGTRVYQKPIHRGAMLETYHDGTQEVVGTTFVDDCQWDRSAEYNAVGVSTIDTTNGYLDIALQYSGIYTKNQFGDFYLSTDVYTSAATAGWQIMFGSDVGSSFSIQEGNKYDLYFNHQTSQIRLSKIVSGVHIPVHYVSDSSIGVWRKVGILKNGSSIKTWVDGVLVIDIIDSTFTSGYIGFGSYAPHTGNVRFKNMQIIGLDSDATNGVAATIPPIGGGARYNEQEKVYKQIVNAAKFGEYKATALVKTTNADAEAVEMYFKNITDTTNVATDNTDTLAIALSDTNYAMSTKDLQLLHGDRDDTIEVSVRKTSAATEVSPACYVTDLMILPKVEG